MSSMNGYASRSERKIAFLIAVVALVATVGFVLFWFAPQGRTAYIEHGIHTISARVASDEADRYRGLSGVEKLNPNEGLLMVFEAPDRHGIVMRDMKIPIDVVWIDSDGSVVHVEYNMKPDIDPELVYRSRSPALYVLEMGSGEAKRLNIKVGDKLDIPEEV